MTDTSTPETEKHLLKIRDRYRRCRIWTIAVTDADGSVTVTKDLTFSAAQKLKVENRLTASRIAIGVEFSVCDMTHRFPITVEHPKAEPVPAAGISLKDAMLAYENKVIADALEEAKGRLTHAANSLLMDYQALAYIIESRHPDLIAKRSPIRRRAPHRQQLAPAMA